MVLLAYDQYNFCSYAFTAFLLSKSSNIVFHQFARNVTESGIRYIAGAYSTAAYHARSIFEISRHNDPTNSGGLYSLFGYPETPIRAEEIIFIAKQILEHDPVNQAALEALKDAAERKEDPITPPRNEREQLEQYILVGKFIQAKQILSVVSERELYAMLIYLGCEERNLCAYAFTWFLMKEKETAELHYLAYRIVTIAYSRNLTGCDAAGIFHLKRAMALEPENEKYIEHFLMLHTPPMGPTSLISDDEAEKVAKQLLDKHRFNVVATNVLKKMNRITPKYD